MASRMNESAPEDSLYISSLMDMRVPGGRGKDKKDGAVQSLSLIHICERGNELHSDKEMNE